MQKKISRQKINKWDQMTSTWSLFNNETLNQEKKKTIS